MEPEKCFLTLPDEEREEWIWSRFGSETEHGVDRCRTLLDELTTQIDACTRFVRTCAHAVCQALRDCLDAWRWFQRQLPAETGLFSRGGKDLFSTVCRFLSTLQDREDALRAVALPLLDVRAHLQPCMRAYEVTELLIAANIRASNDGEPSLTHGLRTQKERLKALKTEALEVQTAVFAYMGQVLPQIKLQLCARTDFEAGELRCRLSELCLICSEGFKATERVLTELECR